MVQEYLDTVIAPVLFPGGEQEVVVQRAFAPANTHGSIAVPSSGPSELYLGKGFFECPPASQVDTLVHECLHTLFRTHNDVLAAWSVGVATKEQAHQLDAMIDVASHSLISQLTKIVIGVLPMPPDFPRGTK